MIGVVDVVFGIGSVTYTNSGKEHWPVKRKMISFFYSPIQSGQNRRDTGDPTNISFEFDDWDGNTGAGGG